MPENNLDKFKQILSKLPEDKRKLLYDRLHSMPSSEREAFIGDFVKKYDDRNKKPAPQKGSGPSPAAKPASANKNIQHKNAANKGKAPTKGSAPTKGAAPNKNATPNKNAAQQKGTAPQKNAVPNKNAAPHKNAAPQKKPSQSGAPVQHKEPVNKQNARKNPAPVKEKEHKNIPDDKAPKRVTASHTEEIEEDNEPVKKNASHSIIIGILVALVLIGGLYIFYLFNKEKIDGKFNQMFGMPAEETIDTSPDPGIMGPEPQHFPTNTPSPIPTPSPVPVPDEHPDLTDLVIVIDPGHQAEADTELEESIPGTTAEKERATQGAVGIDSKTKEYELTLEYALIMKEYLEGCGAEVILTRESNDVDISNIERAKIAKDNKADYFIRLHADSAPDSEIRGVKVYVPSTGSYASSAASDGKKLAEIVAESIGSDSLGCVQSNMYTGLNHADTIKSYQLVIGYLSNSEDDALLNSDETAYNTAVAVAEFFAG